MKLIQAILFLTLHAIVPQAILASPESLVSLETSHIIKEGAAMAEDPFAWLEQMRDDRALAWVHLQNERTQKSLQADARFVRYNAMALEIATDKGRIAARSIFDTRLIDGWVHNVWKDAHNPLGIWRRTKLSSYLAQAPAWETVLDIDRLSRDEGRTWEFRLAGLECVPHRTSRCLISLAEGGQVDDVYREFDLETGSFVTDGFNIPEAKTNVVWKDENTLLITTNWKEREAALRAGVQVTAVASSKDIRMWKRGDAFADSRSIFGGEPNSQFSRLSTYRDVTGERIVLVGSSEGGRWSRWLLDGKDRLQRTSLPARIGQLAFYRGNCVILLREEWVISGHKWPAGALVSLPRSELTHPIPTVSLLAAPGPREAFEDVRATPSGLIAMSSQNVSGRLDRFTLDDGSWRRESIDMPEHGMVRYVMTAPDVDKLLVTYQSFLSPLTLYEVDVPTTKIRALATDPSHFDSSRYVTEQIEAVSKDGTRIPYFLVRPRQFEYTGNTPALLNGYGGFGASQFPMYSGVLGRLWLDQGGVYVLANIRGGREFGPAWHEAATKTNRQRAYDDFIAVAEDLIRRRITSPRRLGITGMSNGGLLVGVMLLQRPELFHAALAKVPLLDPLRRDLLDGGASAEREYGSLHVPEERNFLEGISPYKNLRPQKSFPVPFLVTATNDTNVHPAHARKYAARMESMGMPFYFFESPEGGHAASITPAQTAALDALEFVYFSRQLMD